MEKNQVVTELKLETEGHDECLRDSIRLMKEYEDVLDRVIAKLKELKELQKKQ
ncbi:MAG TPA: hypothetical protein PKJ19_10050 [Flavobacteriales bacterium]|nr:hypothetical protein [Flavobacteriales bacterium]HNU56562.1 hypothetical protein [Flavobacteriales bacterium]